MSENENKLMQSTISNMLNENGVEHEVFVTENYYRFKLDKTHQFRFYTNVQYKGFAFTDFNSFIRNVTILHVRRNDPDYYNSVTHPCDGHPNYGLLKNFIKHLVDVYNHK